MKRLLLMVFLCLALSILIYESAFAFGKITVDPNTGGSPAPKAPADARVAQKVTYEARYVAVQQILEDLTDMTGIELYAGANKNDWPVRNRKMNIFVKDVKMADLMNSIAHAMKFKWSCNDDVNPPTYRLVVDGKAAAAADAQKARAENALDEKWQRRRNEWIDAIMKYGSGSPAELASLREANPVVYRYARYGALKAFQALFSEVPETKARYAAGQSFRISSEELSSQTRDLVHSAGNEMWQYLQEMVWNKAPTGYEEVLKPEDRFDVAYSRMDETGGFTPGLRWGGTWSESTGYFCLMKTSGQDLEMADLRAINEDWSRYVCESTNRRIDHEEPSGSEEEQEDAKRNVRKKKEEESLYPSEPLNEHLTFDDLEKTIKLKIETPKTEQNPEMAINSYIASFQKVLADATGLGIVSDSWANIKGDKLPDQEARLGELLDAFSEQFNYNWDKPSSILEFRHRKWAKTRLNQIPDDLVASWSENTRKNSILSLEDLAQISNLTYDQAEESLKPNKVLGSAGIYGQTLEILDTNGNLHWLRLYSTLNSKLRTQLMDRWISGAMLNFDQWNQALVMFDRIGSLRSDALFSLKIIPNDSNLIYEFRTFEVTAQRDDDTSAKEDRKWVVTLPKYTPPASPKKAAN